MEDKNLIRELLRNSKWYEGRKIDTILLKENLLKEGYDWFLMVEIFLKEFGNLEMIFLLSNGNNDSLHFDALKASRDFDIRWIIEDYSRRIKSKKYCIIGQAFTTHMTLFMDEQGRVYGGFDDSLYLVGLDGKEAIENICLNRKLKEL